MATDSILRSYGDTSRVEDVVRNTIEYLTATETMLLNMLGTTEARDTVHSYLTDTRDAVSAGGLTVAEGADYTATALTTPTRLTNIVEIIAKNFKVTRTQQEIEHYHGQNELQRQTEKALVDWANAAEFELVRSTLVSGVSGTAASMKGVIEATSKSTNHTSHTSGTVFSASILDGLMKANWDNSNGDVATDLFVGSFIRSKIDGFTQKTNVVVNAPGISSIVRTVTTYETAFGTLNIHTHRYIQQSGDATSRVLAVRPEKLKIAYLKRPYVQTDLQRGGDYDNYAVVGKLTLETRNQDSCYFADGFHKTS